MTQSGNKLASDSSPANTGAANARPACKIRGGKTTWAQRTGRWSFLAIVLTLFCAIVARPCPAGTALHQRPNPTPDRYQDGGNGGQPYQTVTSQPPDFGLTSSASTATVASGQSANFNLTLTPNNGFIGAITLPVRASQQE